jgi:hypothetical protein
VSATSVVLTDAANKPIDDLSYAPGGRRKNQRLLPPAESRSLIASLGAALARRGSSRYPPSLFAGPYACNAPALARMYRCVGLSVLLARLLANCSVSGSTEPHEMPKSRRQIADFQTESDSSRREQTTEWGFQTGALNHSATLPILKFLHKRVAEKRTHRQRHYSWTQIGQISVHAKGAFGLFRPPNRPPFRSFWVAAQYRCRIMGRSGLPGLGNLFHVSRCW